jgi:hypothetical protein
MKLPPKQPPGCNQFRSGFPEESQVLNDSAKVACQLLLVSLAADTAAAALFQDLTCDSAL